MALREGQGPRVRGPRGTVADTPQAPLGDDGGTWCWTYRLDGVLGCCDVEVRAAFAAGQGGSRPGRAGQSWALGGEVVLIGLAGHLWDLHTKRDRPRYQFSAD